MRLSVFASLLFVGALLTCSTGMANQSRDPFAFARAVPRPGPYPKPSGHLSYSTLAVCDSRGHLTVTVNRSTTPYHTDVFHRERRIVGVGDQLISTTHLDPVMWTSGTGLFAATLGPPFVLVRCGDPLAPFSTPTNAVIVFGTRALLWRGRPAPFTILPGGEYLSFSGPSFRSTRFVALTASFGNGNTAQRQGLVRIETDGQGGILNEELRLEMLDALPSIGGFVNAFGHHQVSQNGHLLAVVGVGGAGPQSTALWLDGQIVLRDGDLLGSAGHLVETVLSGDVNANGSWLAQVQITGPEQGIVVDGELVWRSGAPGFDTGGRTVRHIRRAALTDHGRAVFLAEAPPTPLLDMAVYPVIGSQLVYQPRSDRFNGDVVSDPSTLSTRLYPCDPEGSFATITSFTTQAPGQYQQYEFILPLVRSTVTCDGPPTSFGSDPTIEYLGSTYTDSEHRHLVAWDLPPQATVVWLRSPVPGSFPLPAGGLGTLCLGPPVMRRAAVTDSRGMSEAPAVFLDQPGRQHFQVWYRDTDTATGNPTSRVSDAVAVDLQ